MMDAHSFTLSREAFYIYFYTLIFILLKFKFMKWTQFHLIHKRMGALSKKGTPWDLHRQGASSTDAALTRSLCTYKCYWQREPFPAEVSHWPWQVHFQRCINVLLTERENETVPNNIFQSTNVLPSSQTEKYIPNSQLLPCRTNKLIWDACGAVWAVY